MMDDMNRLCLKNNLLTIGAYICLLSYFTVGINLHKYLSCHITSRAYTAMHQYF